MIYFGESEVFEREMAEFGYGSVGVERARADFVKQMAELFFIHCRQNNSGSLTIEADEFLETGPADAGHDPV